jgi:phosphoserine phosphatase RsbU/P
MPPSQPTPNSHSDPSGFEQRQTVTMLRRGLREMPDLWAQHDSRNRWFCPHCGEIINSVLVPPERGQALLHDLPHQIQEHLVKCAAARAGLPAQKRLKGQDAALSGLRQALHDATLSQRHMLQTAPQIPGCKIACLYQPKMGIGGDYYAFLTLPDGRFGVAIGDASGHGVECCMLMAVTKKLCLMFGRSGMSPGQCLSGVNREVHADVLQGAFVTASYAILDLKASDMTYARAGHPPALIFNPARETACVTLNPNGLAMGVDAGTKFDRVMEEKHFTLQPGDLILFYTDGLIELVDSTGAEVGTEWVFALMKKNYDRPIDDIVGQIWNQAQKLFPDSKSPDDITLVAVKVEAKTSSHAAKTAILMKPIS